MVKKPNLPLASTLARAAAELSIIVVGVLIALAAQSWWEARLQDEDRDRALVLLHDDLSRLEASLRDSVSAVEVDSAIHRLLDGRMAEDDSTAARQVSSALWDFGFEIGARDGQNLLPAYADLKSSGRLGLLPAGVRARMPGVELQLVVLSRFLDDVVFFQQERVDPILLDRFEIDPGSIDRAGFFGVEDPLGHADVFREPAVRTRLLLKSALLRGHMEEWRQAADSVAEVRELIRAVRPDLCLEPGQPGCRR